MSAASDFAKGYLEDLLSFFGLNTAVEAHEAEAIVELEVPSSHLNGFLIGSRGESLRSLQHLTNMALKTAGFEDTAAVIDIAGYKKQQNERLSRHAQTIAKHVLDTGLPTALDPMTPYERRVIHQAVSEIDGVQSSSEGEGYDRHIVIQKAE